VDRGEDPAIEQRAIKAEIHGPNTVENVFAEFTRRHLVGKARAPRYIADTQRNFENHVLPFWGARLIGDITRPDVITLLDRVVDLGSEERRGRKRGGPVAANNVRAIVRVLFAWAVQRGLIETSPAALVEKPASERARERVLSDTELRLVWRATEALAYPWRPYFRLLICAGQRREETARARWQDLDVAESVWLIETNKSHRAHAVPLSRLALTILAECPQGPGFVFTTGRRRKPDSAGDRGEAPIRGYSAAKSQLDAEIARICAETGEPVPRPWRLHDLRRTATTAMARIGVPRFVLERVLNHADHGVTAVYDRYSYLPEKRDALDKWALHIQALVNPPPALRIVS